MSKPASRTPTGSSDNSFGQLWLSKDVAALADWVVFVALLCYSAMFSDSPSTLGYLIAIMLAPRFLLWPLLGRVVTWRNARAFGMTAQIMRATVLVPAFLLEREDGAQSILIMAGAYALAGPFLAAAQRALFGVVVGDRQVDRARTALTNTWLLTLGVGPAFGYAIYGAGSLRGAAAAAIVALLVSAAMVFTVKLARTGDAEGQNTTELVAGFAPLPTGIAESFRHPALRQVASIQVIAALLAGGIGVLEAAYTTNGLFLAIEHIGLLLASQGVGIAATTLGYQQVGNRYPLSTAVAAGLAFMGGGVLGLAISSGLLAGMGFTLVIGLGIGLLVHCMSEIALRVASSRYSAKTPAVSVRTLVDGAILLSAAIAAPLCMSISPRFALVLSGTLIWVLALYSFGAMPELDDESPLDQLPV